MLKRSEKISSADSAGTSDDGDEGRPSFASGGSNDYAPDECRFTWPCPEREAKPAKLSPPLPASVTASSLRGGTGGGGRAPPPDVGKSKIGDDGAMAGGGGGGGSGGRPAGLEEIGEEGHCFSTPRLPGAVATTPFDGSEAAVSAKIRNDAGPAMAGSLDADVAPLPPGAVAESPAAAAAAVSKKIRNEDRRSTLERSLETANAAGCTPAHSPFVGGGDAADRHQKVAAFDRAVDREQAMVSCPIDDRKSYPASDRGTCATCRSNDGRKSDSANSNPGGSDRGTCFTCGRNSDGVGDSRKSDDVSSGWGVGANSGEWGENADAPLAPTDARDGFGDDPPRDSRTSSVEVLYAPLVEVPLATPVEEEAEKPVYDAVEVTDDSSLPWWKRHRILLASAATLSIAAIIAVAVAVPLASKSEEKTDESPLELAAQQSPTLSPTHSEAPLTCTVEYLGPVHEGCPEWCAMGVARDGDAIVTAVADEWSPDPTELTLGHFHPGQTTHNPDHHVEELAFTEDFFFASNPLPWEGPGDVYITPRDPDGGISWNKTLRLSPEDADDYSGFGTAISAAGDVLAVGAPNDRGDAGSAFVYRRRADVYFIPHDGANDEAFGLEIEKITRTTWTEEARLARGNESSVQTFGNSVLVARGGEEVVVAAENFGQDNEGAVFLYEHDPSPSEEGENEAPWRPATANDGVLVNDDCDGSFGASLALSGDDGLLVGCPSENDSKGAVYYYRRSGDGGSYGVVQKIEARDGRSLEKFGGNNHHLALNSRGDFLAVGTQGDTGQDEKVYVFGKFDDVWKEVARIDAPEGSNFFGTDVVISGERVLVTSWENAYSYRLSCVDEDGQAELI